MSLTGPHLLGFSDFFANDQLGAAVAAKGKAPAGKKAAAKTLPGKPAKSSGKAYPKPARTHAVEQHGKVLHGAHAVVTKAAHVLARAQKLLTQVPARKPVHLGAAAAALSSKQRLAVHKHNEAVAKQEKATKNLVQHAAKAHASASALAKKMVHQRKVAKVLRTPKKNVHVGDMLTDEVIGAHVAEALQQYYDEVGASPDPTNPGFLDDGSPDPAAQAVSTSPAPGADASGDSMFNDGSLSPTDTDPAAFPPPPDMNVFIPDMNAVGGIAYNGEKGRPDGYALSLGLLVRNPDLDGTDHLRGLGTAASDEWEHYGYVWGKYDRLGPEKGISWGSEAQSGTWNWIHGAHGAGGAWNDSVDPAVAFASHTMNNPYGKPYGPLVGNHNLPSFKGMRVDGQGNMFWLPQEAPDWLTFPLKQAAALTAQAAQKAAADAAAADAAAQAKAQADAAAAQSAQDAQNALSESQAASQAKIEQGQAETQAAQALVQQQQADTAQQAMQTEQDKQAGQLLIQQAQQEQAQDQQVQEMLLQQAQREQEFLAQHPDEEPQGDDDDEGGQDAEDDGENGGDGDWGNDRGAGDFGEG